MNWIPLTNDVQLEQLIQHSNSRPQLIFKHSTRCSVSSMARNRLERSSQPEEIDCHFLDLIANRSLSAKVANIFQVQHESPQILLIKNGRCVYDESHTGIRMEDIIEHSTI